MVLKPWVLLAALLLQNQAAGNKLGVLVEDLTEQAIWLRDLSRQFGAFLHWPGTVPVQLLRQHSSNNNNINNKTFYL